MVELEQQYQRLTHAEVLLLSTFEERLKRWKTVKRLIHLYYGDRARFVTIEEADPIEGVFFHYDVQDAQGNVCLMDHNSSGVQEYLDYLNYSDERIDAFTEDDWAQIDTDLHLSIQLDKCVIWERLPRIADVYDLKRPPLLHEEFPALYTFNSENGSYERLFFSQAELWSQAHHTYELGLRIDRSVPRYFSQARFVVLTTEEKDVSGRAFIADIDVLDEDHQSLWTNIRLPWYESWLKEQPEQTQQKYCQIPLSEWQRESLSESAKKRILQEVNFPAIEAEYDLQNSPPLPDHLDIYRRKDRPFLPETEV